MFHRSRPEILGEHVGLRTMLRKISLSALVFQIEDDALLAAIDETEIEGLIFNERPIRFAYRRRAWRFDLDDPGAEIAQNRRAERAV